MVGAPVEEVEQGMRYVIQELRNNPYALETVFVSVIVFAGKAKIVLPLTELYQFYPPKLPVGGGTSLGEGLNALMDDIDNSVQKTTEKIKGDWKPIVFLFTDGIPTDQYEKNFERWNIYYRNQCSLIAISVGRGADVSALSKLTDNIVIFDRENQQSYQEFFDWITASIKTRSMSIAKNGFEQEISELLNESDLCKIDLKKIVPEKVDDNYVVLVAKCQETKQPYLIKFIKKVRMMEGFESLNEMNLNERYFKLQGAYPIDEKNYLELTEPHYASVKVSTIDLEGSPSCPCCGNSFGMIICQCGGIFCGELKKTLKCPWCNSSGYMKLMGKNLDINRSQG